MIVTALLLMQASTEPTYAEVVRLAPSAAGELVLHGQEHGRVDAMEAPTAGLGLPGYIDGQLVEQSVASGQGCVRRRWTMRFRARLGADPSTGILESTYSTTEIALSKPDACPSAHYVRLNPSVEQANGFDALRQLDRIRSGALDIKLDCSDRTSSDLCADDRGTRRALATLSPWAVSRDGVAVLIWLGTPGGIVTEVRLVPAQPGYALVTRQIPAPF